MFDPVLSLTGGCGANAADPVPDPGPCPGTPGVNHPANAFTKPMAVATDSYGNIFVASFGQASNGSDGRVDVFDSSGLFISEKKVIGPKSLAVDAGGNLYVVGEESKLFRYEPSVYEPAGGKIAYGKESKLVAGASLSEYIPLAVNPLNQHVFSYDGQVITEYGSASEGNKFIETIGSGLLGAPFGFGMAIDASRGRIYASALQSGKAVIRVLELAAPHKEIETIDGSTTPAGKFILLPALAVEESTGDLFAYETQGGAEVVYELGEDGEYLATIDRELESHAPFGAQIGVDNGANSPNGAESAFGSHLYVPAFPSATGHSFAFGPVEQCPPKVESTSFSSVGEEEAKLQAVVNPCNLETTYTLEYTTRQSFEEEGFAGATIAGEGQLPANFSPEEVSAALTGLEAGTTYRFRVSAENEEGEGEGEGEFATYPATEGQEPCPNEALRTGFSTFLPDCRSYELVTPPDTNARSPLGTTFLGTFFTSRQASPAGEKVSFLIEGGLIPGNEGGTGSLGGDPYLSTRTAQGWSTAPAGPDGAETPALLPGSTSPDQGYSLWSTAGDSGSASIGGATNYVRYPDGHSALVGRGDLGTDPRAAGKLISEDGGHILFVSGGNFPAVQLEEDAPPNGTNTIYDRTADEVTHVVSLLPGNATPSAGQNALYRGASLDGKGVAFSIGKKLYLRFDDEETYEIGEGVTFAGVAEGGARIFYLKAGDLFAFDAKKEETIRFTEAGDVTPVNVATEGTAAYFVSPSVLTGEANPNGVTAQPGEENLYLSQEGALSFVGTVTERDVEGEGTGNEQVDGLGLWTEAVNDSRLGKEPSRTTPDGGVMLFESRANLAGYDPEGHAEVYRYDFAANELDCLSCNPTLAAATGEASLQSISHQKFEPEPLTTFSLVANLRADGQRAFFQSTEALVPGDSDELQDVYEWEAQGVGSCDRDGGCVYLISSGQSLRIDYLYAVSDSGDDAFFRSSDLLLSADIDETPSVYDARVGGGFAEGAGSEECQGEGCRPGLSAPPGLPTPGMLPDSETGNLNSPHSCPKGRHKVTKNGKTRCIKKHKKHKRHQRKAGQKKGAGK